MKLTYFAHEANFYKSSDNAKRLRIFAILGKHSYLSRL